MRRALQFALLFLLLGTTLTLRAGEIIDRIVATVNDSAILASDLDTALRYQAMLEGRPLDSLTAADQRAVLDRLIDQRLLQQQMGTGQATPTNSEIARRLQQLRAQMAGAQTDSGWQQLLSRYGLSESEVTELLAVQMQISGFMEQRLRPGIHIGASDIEAYYRDSLLPKLRQSGVQTPPPLSDVTHKIREILVQQRMNEDLVSWLRSLREQGRIQMQPETSSPGASQSAYDGWHAPSTAGK